MFLELFDLFKLPFHLNFLQQSKHSSHIGIICSIAIYVFLLYNFSMSDMLQRNSPLVLNQSFQKQYSERIDLKKKLIAVSVNDIKKNYYIDPSMFSFEIRYFLNESYFEVKKAHICTKEDVFFNESLYEFYSLNSSYCVNVENMFLKGFWDENKITYMSISLIMCNNLTDNITCKDQNEIINYFKTTKIELAKYITLLMHQSQIDLYDYLNPLKVKYQMNSQLIDPDLIKKNFYYLKNIHVDSDDGYIFESKTVHSDITLNSKDFDFQLRYSDSLPFFQIVLYASKEVVKCTRIYQKLPDLLGSLLGIAQLFTFFCTIISGSVIYVNTLKLFLGKLYFIPKLKESQKSANDNKVLSKKEIKLNENILKKNEQIILFSRDCKSKLNTLTKKTSKVQNIKKKNDYKPKSDNNRASSIQKKEISSSNTKSKLLLKKQNNDTYQFNITFWGYFIYILKKKIRLKLNPTETLIEEVERIYQKQIDIITILNKIQEIKNMKRIFLDENNRILFRQLPKPIIPVKDKNIFENFEKSSDLKHFLEKIKVNFAKSAFNMRRVRSLTT